MFIVRRYRYGHHRSYYYHYDVNKCDLCETMQVYLPKHNGKTRSPRCFFLSAIIHRREYVLPTTALNQQQLRLPRAQVTNLNPLSPPNEVRGGYFIFIRVRECVWCTSVRAQLTAPSVPRGNQVPRNEVNEITNVVWGGGGGDGRKLCVCCKSFPEFISDAWYLGI